MEQPGMEQSKIRNAKQLGIFKKMIIAEKRENSLFPIHNPVGVKLLIHLRLQLSDLIEHKFRHGFEDTISPRLCAHVIQKLKVMNTSSCIAIFILLKD